jgi:hypothetical protein
MMARFGQFSGGFFTRILTRIIAVIFALEHALSPVRTEDIVHSKVSLGRPGEYDNRSHNHIRYAEGSSQFGIIKNLSMVVA